MYVLHMYQYHKCNDCRRLRDAFKIVPFIGNSTPKDAHLEASAQMLERAICAGVYYVKGKRAKTAETLSKEEKSLEKFKTIKGGFLKHFERNG